MEASSVCPQSGSPSLLDRGSFSVTAIAQERLLVPERPQSREGGCEAQTGGAQQAPPFHPGDKTWEWGSRGRARGQMSVSCLCLSPSGSKVPLGGRWAWVRSGQQRLGGQPEQGGLAPPPFGTLGCRRVRGAQRLWRACAGVVRVCQSPGSGNSSGTLHPHRRGQKGQLNVSAVSLL